MEKLKMEDLAQVVGGVNPPVKRQKFVSAFYCEYCGSTIRLNGVYTLERAKKEHNAKFHPGIRP